MLAVISDKNLFLYSFSKWITTLVVAMTVLACKKQFTPPVLISDNSRYLVIEGVINAGNDSTIIKLSRTKKIDTLRTVFPEANAQVSVESDGSNTFVLREITTGTYAAAPLGLDNSHKYRLRIKTSDNKEYVSDFIPVKNAPPIDSVGFAAKTIGLEIYVNTHDANNATKYYRWEYREDWQFHSAYVSTYYSDGLNALSARLVSQQVYYCFGSVQSSNILIASTTKLNSDVIYHSLITVVPPTSEKLETRYSILVKQYALTSDAYSFWDNMQKNTEKLGSIFDVLPSESQTNYHCVSNPNELVIGYLSVGNPSYQRIFISADQLLSGYSPVYPTVCEIDTAFQNPPHSGTLPIADLIPASSPYVPVLGLYLKPPNINGSPTAYTYSTILCADCTVRGTTTMPAFWK
ncbi:DUF4249 domain-containing protein [uncultured Mucilaginibacter sp.]|uniref:DUF4249 domain-containing protein n=1 Tax=uncultured Mucilaginibacter sp. TaxID=797541 RepID=UPI0025DB6D3E|nr:DUF4249 domain-containing protein [uncultured Mucilaginibacter sp.]